MTDQPAVPLDGNVLDLDAAEAARREGRGVGLEVKYRGVQYLLPLEMPMEAVEALAGMADVDVPDEDAKPELAAAALRTVGKALDQGLAVLFCTCPELPEKKLTKKASHLDADCQWPRLLQARPSMETRLALVQGVWAAYGVSLGEALGPLQQSDSSGPPSVRTSSGSTGSTPATSGGGPQDRKPSTKKKAAKKAPARKRAGSPVKAAGKPADDA